MAGTRGHSSNVKTCATHGTILQPRQRCSQCDHHHDGAGLESRHSMAWRRYRRLVLYQRPLCELCKAAGLTVPATEVHHLVERAHGGTLFPGDAGVQALCKPCHSAQSLMIQSQSPLHTPLTFTQPRAKTNASVV